MGLPGQVEIRRLSHTLRQQPFGVGQPALARQDLADQVDRGQAGRIGGTGVSGFKGGRCRFHLVSSS